MNNCPYCQAELKDEDKFCPQCRSILTKDNKFLKPKIWYHPLVTIISMLIISTFFLIFYHHPLMEKNKELTSEEQAKSSSEAQTQRLSASPVRKNEPDIELYAQQIRSIFQKFDQINSDFQTRQKNFTANDFQEINQEINSLITSSKELKPPTELATCKTTLINSLERFQKGLIAFFETKNSETYDEKKYLPHFKASSEQKEYCLNLLKIIAPEQPPPPPPVNIQPETKTEQTKKTNIESVPLPQEPVPETLQSQTPPPQEGNTQYPTREIPSEPSPLQEAE